MNNPYLFDEQDFGYIFQSMGIHTFKFPFEVTRGEYISISYVVYEKGREVSRGDVIEDFQLELDLRMDHHLARKDTTVFHRIYCIEQGDSILKLHFALPGIVVWREIDLSRVLLGSYTATLNIDPALPEKRAILYYYANFKDNDSAFLECATGTSVERLIAAYDMAVVVFAERISRERAKTILEEEYFETRHNL